LNRGRCFMVGTIKMGRGTNLHYSLVVSRCRARSSTV
jgi:hypothetical protein